MMNFNWNKEFALQQAADDADLLQELLELFKGSCANDITLIERGLENNDAEQVRAAAHSIKGAAASLGMHGIRDVALSIETAARANDLAAAQEHLSVLERFGVELQTL
ncbi:Hpt domain-containing protein [Desulfofustis glycolicus]|uniref:Hpt domain-containing protein n=1 Tax=Desulfofustis glycolicus DSM 9705 TaxID=1121409 RepID=A0A1M5U3T2_9BACT|nr:Hpt domain-containing protein [Desulfofustis glycolicus]MCB2214668.1 Hpt domain-containing protein [Desulfobulbaceae bacterium]SHH57682.1 Hpt domain-containing protein [Desulfofustis glycolicus DSM 9705]